MVVKGSGRDENYKKRKTEIERERKRGIIRESVCVGERVRERKRETKSEKYCSTCLVSSPCFIFTATSNTFNSVCLLLISGWFVVNSFTTLLIPSGPALFNILKNAKIKELLLNERKIF